SRISSHRTRMAPRHSARISALSRGAASPTDVIGGLGSFWGVVVAALLVGLVKGLMIGIILLFARDTIRWRRPMEPDIHWSAMSRG
ncbi:hypothetical protein VB636_00820, partial [Paracoccus sp. APAP_BH8]